GQAAPDPRPRSECPPSARTRASAGYPARAGHTGSPATEPLRPGPEGQALTCARRRSYRAPPRRRPSLQPMNALPKSASWFVIIACSAAALAAQAAPETAVKAAPVFVDGQAQVVEAFADPKEWIREQVFVDTGIDSDDDGKTDRMHVCITRPKQTDTEG